MGVFVRTSSLNYKHSCQLFRKASSLVLLRHISDVVIASVYFEKTRMKKLMLMKMIIIIIIIMNKSQELTVFHGRQKLTSAKN